MRRLIIWRAGELRCQRHGDQYSTSSTYVCTLKVEAINPSAWLPKLADLWTAGQVPRYSSSLLGKGPPVLGTAVHYGRLNFGDSCYAVLELLFPCQKSTVTIGTGCEGAVSAAQRLSPLMFDLLQQQQHPAVYHLSLSNIRLQWQPAAAGGTLVGDGPIYGS